MMNKKYKIYAEILEDTALEQFESAMAEPFVIKGALMPDSHTGYSLPIGGVIATKDVIVPAWVGYDIGCGVTALKTHFHKDELTEENRNLIFSNIYKYVPTGILRNLKPEKWDYSHIDRTPIMDEIMNKEKGLTALTTLGGGNHFIEIGYDENNEVWIVIHSGSRKVGHATASYYMLEAKKASINKENLEKEFEEKNIKFKKNNYERFIQAKEDYANRIIEKELKGKKLEGHFGFNIHSKLGKDYIKDLNFALQFALENRKRMVERVYKVMANIIENQNLTDDEILNHTIDVGEYPEDIFINRNHNHAELNNEGLWVHRKGATHAEEGMYGVIPGNMKDGSFIVMGKGNPDSICSSSHGAGRILSRTNAMKNIELSDFQSSMEGITALVNEGTKDESLFAYKNIFDVMNAQKDLVDIVHHIKPLINIKADNSKFC